MEWNANLKWINQAEKIIREKRIVNFKMERTANNNLIGYKIINEK